MFFNIRNLSNERRGELLIVSQIFIAALSPVLIKDSQNILPPLFFAGASMLLASLIFLIVLVRTKHFNQVFNRKALPYMLGGTILLMLVVFPLRFIAGQKTTAGNLAILWQAEILFTFLIFGFLGIERITKARIFGASLIILGVVLILQGNISSQMTRWNLLILLATFIAPFANILQKKSVQIVSPTAYLFFRNIIGGVILLVMSSLYEQPIIDNVVNTKGLVLIAATGVLVFAISKLLFLHAIRLVDVHKTIALKGSQVALSLVLAFIFLAEIPTITQILGFIIILAGAHKLIDKGQTFKTNGKTWTSLN